MSLLGGEGAPSEAHKTVDYGSVPYNELPTPETWSPSLAKVPGDDANNEEDFESMEEKIRAKYTPAKLDKDGNTSDIRSLMEGQITEEMEKEAASCSALFSKAASKANREQMIFPCLTCDGQGKVYQKMNLTEVQEGMSRVLESSCKECRGQGIINKLEEVKQEELKRGTRAAQEVVLEGRYVRLDQDDPAMDMDAILAAAGPSPFERKK